MSGADTQTIIEQVRQCPSGALSYFMNEEAAADRREGVSGERAEIMNIEVQPDGPILITTACHIKHSNGEEETRTGRTSLCRCGASANKPYCDSSHIRINFKG